MDYSCLVGIRYLQLNESVTQDQLPHNAVLSTDHRRVYYLGFVDILQHYNLGWKLQHFVLSAVQDKKKITALPPAEYALRFLNFLHTYLLRDNTGSYGSIHSSPLREL